MNTGKTHRIGIRCSGWLLAAVLLFVTSGSVFGMTGPQEDAGAYTSYYEEKEHADIDYADMPYVGVNGQALDALLTELEALTAGQTEAADPVQRTVEIYREILRVMEEEYTQYTLGDVLHFRDVTDAAQAEKNTQDMLAIQDMSDAAFLALQKALQGPYADALREEFSAAQLTNLEEYQALTVEEKELLETDKNLQQAYDRLAEEEYSFEYKGEVWTMNRLYEETPEEYDDIVTIFLGISKAMNDEAVPVYQDMIRNRRAIAAIEGYDTYTDYCYDTSYGRDFTGEDIAALRETIVEELCPLYEELRTMQYMSDFTTNMPAAMSGDEIVDTLAEHMGNVHPALMEAYTYFRDHHLYYIDNTPVMADAGFTTDLPAYGSAMIYYKTGGTLQDLETVVHEFGHFNAAYHARQNILTDSLLVDVAEIQSQGLEMLFMEEMQKIAPKDPEGLQLYMVVNMLDSVLTGFEYDEFQQEVYARGDMTVEELNRLAMDIDNKYTQYFFDDDGQAYEWVMINHTFDSPLYYIGYATSALSALDIWTESLQDRDAAVDKYMRLSAVPTDMPYQEAVTSCGLRNMLEKESIRALADEIRAWAGLEKEGSIGEHMGPVEEQPQNAEEAIGDTGADTAADTYEEDNAVSEFGEDTESAGEDSVYEPDEPDSVFGEYLQEEDAEAWLLWIRRILWPAVGVGFGLRILILIIALAAHARRKRRRTELFDSGGYRGNGYGNGNYGNTGYGNAGNDSGSQEDGPQPPQGWE